ncbi:MAG: glycosyltransferase, partial [Candidatus Omnitrophica bacterium]|nr:glycosyltransferase [Candidatus Omnitrophota bacterium]
MKILHVMPSYIPAYRYGGPIKAVHELCKALVKRGVGTSVFTTNIDLEKRLDVPLNNQQDVEGVKVTYFRVNFPASYCYSRDLHKAMETQAHKFDVVHIHSVFLYPTYAAVCCCRHQGIPYIINPFGALDPDMIKLKNAVVKNIYIKLIERRNIINAAAVHTASIYEKEQFLALGFNVPVAVVPRGLNLEDYVSAQPPKDIRKDYPQLDGKKLILFLGRIHQKKGLDLLAEGLKKVVDNRKDVCLVIAGPDEDNYAGKIKRLL